jgi:hypothetical protein
MEDDAASGREKKPPRTQGTQRNYLQRGCGQCTMPALLEVVELQRLGMRTGFRSWREGIDENDRR